MPFESNLALRNILYVSQNNPSKCNPKLKMKTSLEVLDIICPSQEPASRGHCHYKEVKTDGWLYYSSHCTENMYHIALIWVLYFILYSWIDVLDLSHPFDWRANIWEPFKMKLIWGLQSWPLWFALSLYKDAFGLVWFRCSQCVVLAECCILGNSRTYDRGEPAVSYRWTG